VTALRSARIAWIAPLLWAGAITAAGATVSVIDDSGATVTLARPAERIVSLAPHLTELLFAVDAGAVIVGTTEFADFPAAAQSIPRVARAHSVDLERLAALKPDLVVLWGSGFPAATAEAIRRLGVPLFISEPRSLDDIATSLERLATLSGRDGRGVAAEYRGKIESLRLRYSDRAPLRVFYQIWASPLMTLNGRHLVSEAIVLCGGRNVFADLAPLAPQISVEAVVTANPELIVTAEPNAQPSGALDSWKRFSTLSAVERKQIVTLDANRINRHGPRLADEVGQLCEAIDRARRR